MLVGDSGLAAPELLAALAHHRLARITRLRPDAALHDPAPPRLPGFRETRAHPGVETQRQWSDQAIGRTTPCLLGLSSLVTLPAAQLRPAEREAATGSAWYREQGWLTSRRTSHHAKPRPALQRALVRAIRHAP